MIYSQADRTDDAMLPRRPWGKSIKPRAMNLTDLITEIRFFYYDSRLKTVKSSPKALFLNQQIAVA